MNGSQISWRNLLTLYTFVLRCGTDGVGRRNVRRGQEASRTVSQPVFTHVKRRRRLSRVHEVTMLTSLMVSRNKASVAETPAAASGEHASGGSLSSSDQAHQPIGMATKWVLSAVFTRINT